MQVASLTRQRMTCFPTPHCSVPNKRYSVLTRGSKPRSPGRSPLRCPGLSVPGSHNCSPLAALRCTCLARLGRLRGAKDWAESAPRDICAIAAIFGSSYSLVGPRVLLKLRVQPSKSRDPICLSISNIVQLCRARSARFRALSGLDESLHCDCKHWKDNTHRYW